MHNSTDIGIVEHLGRLGDKMELLGILRSIFDATWQFLLTTSPFH